MSVKNPIRLMLAVTLLASSALVAGCFTNGEDADHYTAEPEETAEAESAIDIEADPVLPEDDDLDDPASEVPA